MTKLNTLYEIATEFNCVIKYNEPLCCHTTFKVGGPCTAMIFVNSSESLSKLISYCINNEISYLVIGNGSNLLVDDRGFNGIVFKFSDALQEIKLVDDKTIKACAGCQLSKLSHFAMENSLTGLEFAWGIPGTVGGATYMNAGAYGGEMKQVVKSVEAVSIDGDLVEIIPDENTFSYRHSVFQDNQLIVTAVYFSLEKGDKSQIKAYMDDLMCRRKDKQPIEFPSAGSTFKRPEGAFAAALIEQCGLKGTSCGGAEVSTKHSGFIINKGNATCKDILNLIDIVKKDVFEKTGFSLECEVKIIGWED